MKISSFLRGAPVFHNGSLEEGLYSLKINIPKVLSKISPPVNFQAFLRLRISILSEIGEIETLEDENIQINDQPLRVNFHPLSRSNFKSPIPFSLFLRYYFYRYFLHFFIFLRYLFFMIQVFYVIRTCGCNFREF